VEELILFEHFMPVEQIDIPVPLTVGPAVAAQELIGDDELPTYNECLANNFSRTADENTNLIDFSEDERMLNVTEAGNTLADADFRRCKRLSLF